MELDEYSFRRLFRDSLEWSHTTSEIGQSGYKRKDISVFPDNNGFYLEGVDFGGNNFTEYFPYKRTRLHGIDPMMLTIVAESAFRVVELSLHEITIGDE